MTDASQASSSTCPPLKILHFLPTIRVADGGVVRAVLDWCAVLSARGHHVTLVTHDATDVPNAWRQGGPGLPRLVQLPPPIRFGRLSQEGVRAMHMVLRQADVVHLHAPWVVANVQIARIARGLGKPYLLTVHGMLDDWSMSQRTLKKRIFLMLFARKLLNQAATVHCTASAELKQASKWFSNPRTTVLPYLVDLKPFEILPGPALARSTFHELQTTDPIILFLSRIHEKKGVDLLIYAAEVLRNRGQAGRFLIAGTGDPSYVAFLKSKITELNMENRIFLIGLAKGESKISLYQTAAVFVLPTSQENFGLVLIESLACGTPVITTRGVDIWEELAGAGGIIVDRTPSALADAIARALASTDESVGAAGRAWVFESLDPERLSDAYVSRYRSLIEASKRASPTC